MASEEVTFGLTGVGIEDTALQRRSKEELQTKKAVPPDKKSLSPTVKQATANNKISNTKLKAAAPVPLQTQQPVRAKNLATMPLTQKAQSTTNKEAGLPASVAPAQGTQPKENQASGGGAGGVQLPQLPKTDVRKTKTADSKPTDDITRKSKLADMRPSEDMALKFMSQTQSQMLTRVQKLENLRAIMENVRRGKDLARKDKKGQIPENQNFLSLYQTKIVEDYNTLYEQSNYEKVITELKTLEKKNFLSKEIKRNEEMLSQEKKLFNENAYEIAKKKEHLQRLESQIAQLDALRGEEGQQQYRERLNCLNDLKQRYEDEIFEKESLQYMGEDRKRRVNNVKKDVGTKYKKIRQLQFEHILLKKQQLMQCHSIQDRVIQEGQLRLQIENYKQYCNKIGEHFEEQLADELSEFEDKRALQEIFKHEQKRKEEQEKLVLEKREQEQAEQREERNRLQEEVRKETRKIVKEFDRLDNDFDKLRKVTYVNDTDELLNHKSYLRKCKDDIQQFKNMFEDKIERTKEEIAALSQRVKELKYSSADGKSMSDSNALANSAILHVQAPTVVEGEMETTEKVEQEHLTEVDRCYKAEQESKRLRRVIDSICTVISRMLYQLNGRHNKQKNIEVTKTDLLDQISICSLRLEKYLAILSKKKDTIRVESVNTDSLNDRPPDFLGINPKRVNPKQLAGGGLDASALENAAERRVPGDAENNSLHFSYNESDHDPLEVENLAQLNEERLRILKPEQYDKIYGDRHKQEEEQKKTGGQQQGSGQTQTQGGQTSAGQQKLLLQSALQ